VKSFCAHSENIWGNRRLGLLIPNISGKWRWVFWLHPLLPLHPGNETLPGIELQFLFPSSSWLSCFQLQYPTPVEHFIFYRHTWQVCGTGMKSRYSKLPLLCFPWFCAFFNGSSQIPIRTMFPRFYTFLDFAPYLGGPPQKCKIEVLLHLFRLVLSEVSLILCSCYHIFQ
jgi:hypothetical protein